MSMRKLIIAIVVFGFLLSILAFAIFQGKQRHIFPAKRFEKFVPVPELYEDYMGGYQWLEDGRVKIEWRHRDIHPNQTRPYFLLEGRIRGVDTHYYLLEMDGHRYVEKADHIEPLIHALLALSRGDDPDDHEDEIDDSIAALPEDPDLLVALVRRFPR